MSNPLPLRSSIDHDPRHRIVIDIEDERSTDVFDALGSETARSIYAILRAEPSTTSDIADHIDTSIQNVQYHLEQLVDADLVTAVDIWYSSRGREMNVYAVTADQLLIRGEPESNELERTSLAPAD